jgi:hypothetical protein
MVRASGPFLFYISVFQIKTRTALAMRARFYRLDHLLRP